MTGPASIVSRLPTVFSGYSQLVVSVSQIALTSGCLCVGNIDRDIVEQFLGRFQLTVRFVADSMPIPGSFWGNPEAGIIGHRVFVRSDTPVHSMLHEACHIICMPAERRENLNRNAGGDDLEEAAVCYLQIVLANSIPGVKQKKLMQEMDAWGYSFRLGSTARWFGDDADDACSWLQTKKLLDSTGNPCFRLR